MSEAEDNLRNNQEQLDPEGVMVSVSRQAVDEVLKELASAKAENGRLLSVINEAHKVVYEVYEIVGIGQKAIDRLWEVLQMLKPEGKTLSTSNALDYWQGEIRRAELKVWGQAIEEAGKKRIIFTTKDDLLSMDRDDRIRKKMRDEIVEAMKSRQSNQSKGEKGEG